MFSRSSLALLMMALALLGLSPLAAQDNTAPTNTPEPSATTSVTVVVSAARSEEAASEAATMTSVISTEQIEESGAQDVVELLRSVTGISFRSTSGESYAEISMRGFGENSGGRVLVLIDGRRQNNVDMSKLNWQIVPIESIERIEILHGSASVLYGDNAVAGLINIITKKPTEEKTQTGLSLSLGTEWANSERFTMTSAGKGGRISAYAENLFNPGYRDRSEEKSLAAAIDGELYLGDSLSLRLFGQFSDASAQLPGALSWAQFQANPRQAVNAADASSTQNFDGSLLLEWQALSSLSLLVPIEYGFSARKADTASWSSWSSSDIHKIESRPALRWDLKPAGIETRLSTGVDFRLDLLSASIYSDSTRDTLSNSFRITQWKLGPYLHLRGKLPFNLTATAGARWDISSLSGENHDGSADGTALRDALVYAVGLNWKAVDWLRFFGSWGSTFRYPFTDEQTSYYGFGGDSFLSELRPEKGTDLRFGLALYPHKSISLESQGYWLEMSDEIAYNSATFRNENLDATRRLGADVSLIAQAFAFLKLSANYSFVHASFSNGANDGKLIPLVPQHTVKGEAFFMLPADITLSANAVFNSEAFQGGDYSNEQAPIAAWWNLGAALSFKPKLKNGKLQFLVRADNILDLSYAPMAYYSPFSDTSGWYPAAGRSLRVELRYSF
jgi:iron complex outermembrane recepter protein